MFNNRGGRVRGRGRGKNNNNNDDNKNNKEDVQFLVDYLPQNVIRKQRTTTPKKNLGLGQERAFDGITELERIYFIDVEESADDLPENFELLLGPIPNSVGLYTEPIDVACHRFDKERRANDASKRSSTSRKKYDGVISAPKVMEVISNSNSKMATKVSNHSSMGSSQFQNNGTGTSSGERIQESNSNSNDTNPWVLFDIPEPIPYNLSQIRIEKSLFSAGMINQSRVVNFFADLDSDSDNE